MSQLMQAYSDFTLRLAAVAQQHQAEAMFLGNETNQFFDALLWSEKTQSNCSSASIKR